MKMFHPDQLEDISLIGLRYRRVKKGKALTHYIVIVCGVFVLLGSMVEVVTW